MLLDIVKYVNEEGTATPTGVARELGISRDFAAQMLKDLAQRGLIHSLACSGCTGCSVMAEPTYVVANGDTAPAPAKAGCAKAR